MIGRCTLRMLWPLVGVLLLAGISGCQSPRTETEIDLGPAYVEASGRYAKRYLIVEGDGLDVLVRGNPEVSRPVIVRPDGFISLPLLGDVQAAGLTIPDLDEKVTELYAPRLVDPEVTVIATSVREPMIYIFGEVAQPQPVPYRQARTAAQAVGFAGGFRLGSLPRAVVLIRLGDDGVLRAMPIEVTGDGQPTPYMALQATLLQPDDLILVPKSGITQINEFIDQHINKPLTGVNSILQPVANFLIIERLIEDDEI